MMIVRTTEMAVTGYIGYIGYIGTCTSESQGPNRPESRKRMQHTRYLHENT